jgi:hypothetical protein
MVENGEQHISNTLATPGNFLEDSWWQLGSQHISNTLATPGIFRGDSWWQ